jgi:AraC family L-rhamnose operon regulatory protein RhaS
MARSTTSRRNAYHFTATPLPALPELAYAGSMIAHTAEPLPRHSHDVLEMCYVERGQAQWQIGGDICDVRGGCMVVIPAFVFHGGLRQVHEPCRYYFFGLRLRAGSLGLSRGEARTLASSINQLSPRCFAVPPSLAAEFKRISSVAKAPPAALLTVEIKAALLRILAASVEIGHNVRREQRSTAVTAALRFIETHAGEPFSLPDMARRLGWSVSHLKNTFGREMGIGPAEFHLRRRIAHACADLSGSKMEITRVALKWGFSSSQYFATAFKRVMGVTPRKYREETRGDLPG